MRWLLFLMRAHRPFTVFGSRFLFFALAPWLLVCIPLFPYMAINFGDGAGVAMPAALASALCLVGLLVAVDSWRFLRLNIAMLYFVPIAYLGYFALTYFRFGQPLALSARPSQPSPFNALLGLLFWGVPCWVGAGRLRRKLARLRAVEPRLRLRRKGLRRRSSG